VGSLLAETRARCGSCVWRWVVTISGQKSEVPASGYLQLLSRSPLGATNPGKDAHAVHR
jgi:hypothetical protein